MNQPQQHYEVTDGDFDFIWKNIDSPLVVRDRINVIKTRSHPYQSERDAVLERLHIWFENYCEGNEDPDLWMAFLHAERTLRQAGEPDA